VSEDVYRRLSRLAAERNKTINDLIEELLNNHEGGVSSGVVGELGEIKAMLRECLDRLSAGGPRTVGAVPVEAKPEANSGLEAEGVGGFEDNPWVQILRAKSRG